MSKEMKPYTEVQQRNGVTRRVPKEYNKPLGKSKTVCMTLPISLVEVLNTISEESHRNKSRVITELLIEALEAREQVERS